MTARILVVEDDRGIRDMLGRGLRVAGHQPHFAETAAEAQSAWLPGVFDIVLLDVMLPDGDGIALLSHRRAAGDRTPVVLLSAREQTELRERGTAAGATEYLPKPFAYAELLACIERVVAEGGQSSSESGSSRGAPTGD